MTAEPKKDASRQVAANLILAYDADCGGDQPRWRSAL